MYVALDPCDLRKSFNGLLALVGERLGEDARQGALFVFSNRRHTRLKILYWDGTGLWVMIKRLEQGSFAWPRASAETQASGKLRLEAARGVEDQESTYRTFKGRIIAPHRGRTGSGHCRP